MLTPSIRNIVLNPPVSRRAVALWRARNYNATLDALVDESRNGLHARLGSAVGADSNDPLLIRGGEKHLYFPGIAGNGPITPDAAPLDVSTQCEAFFRLRATDWTGATVQAFMAKWSGGAGGKGFIFETNISGTLNFGFTTDGTTDQNRASTVNPALTDGEVHWLRFRFRGDNGAGGHDVEFHKQADTGSNVPPTTGWTQIGTTVTTAGTRSIANVATGLQLGSYGAGFGSEIYTGGLYYAELRAVIGGPAVASFDASKVAEPYASYTDAQGNVWTLTRPTTKGAKLAVIDSDCLLGSLDDFILAPINQPIGTGDFTVVGVCRVPNATPAGSNQVGGPWYLGPSNISNVGADSVYCYFASDARLLVVKRSAADGFQNPVGSNGFVTAYAGQKVCIALTRLAGRWYLYVNGILLDSSTSFAAENVAGNYFGWGTADGNHDQPWHAGALFMQALTPAEHVRLARELGVSV